MNFKDIIKEKQETIEQSREREKAISEFREYVRENVCRGMTIFEEVEEALTNRFTGFNYFPYLDTTEEMMKELHWWMRESPYSEYIRADSCLFQDRIVLKFH
jgi:hypothetical protein